MAFSFSNIRGYGKGTTLPSVESWNTAINIVKDPPKAIHTRRRDRVGDTVDTLQDTCDALDRNVDAIQRYPRGINLMTDINYTNMSLPQTNTRRIINQVAPKLPKNRRIAKHGAFRMPVVPPQSLRPLSRMARKTTSMHTLACFNDFSKKLRVWHDGKGVKESMLSACANPIRTFDINEDGRDQAAHFAAIAHLVRTTENNPTIALADISSRIQHVDREGEHGFDGSRYVVDRPGGAFGTMQQFTETPVDVYEVTQKHTSPNIVLAPANVSVTAPFSWSDVEFKNTNVDNVSKIRANVPIASATTNADGQNAVNVPIFYDNGILEARQTRHNPLSSIDGRIVDITPDDAFHAQKSYNRLLPNQRSALNNLGRQLESVAHEPYTEMFRPEPILKKKKWSKGLKTRIK